MLIQVYTASASFRRHRPHRTSCFVICKAFAQSARLSPLGTERGALLARSVLCGLGLAYVWLHVGRALLFFCGCYILASIVRISMKETA